MPFADLAIRDGVGVCYWLDLSSDEFATVSHRYATVSGALDGVNLYDYRIAGLGNLMRGFGSDGIAAAGSVDLTLENTDGGVDWLCEQASAATVLKTRVRIYIGLYDPVVPGTIDSKQLGEFVFMDFPRRTLSTVRATLVDDMLGGLADARSTPTLADWFAHPHADHNNAPGHGSVLVAQYTPTEQQLPLAFGQEATRLLPMAWYENPVLGSALHGRRGLVAWVTRQNAVQPEPFAGLLWIIDKDGRAFYILPNQASGISWETKVTPYAINKGGVDWWIVWVSLDLGTFHVWAVNNGLVDQYSTQQAAFEAVDEWHLYHWPMSSVALPSATSQHAADVIRDLVLYYSARTGEVDEARFARLKAALPWANVQGTVGPMPDEPQAPALRDVITDIARSADLDIYATWTGIISAFHPAAYDAAQESSLLELFESDVARLEEWLPSHGERGAPYNRVALVGSTEPLTGSGSIRASEGPYDNAAGIEEWGRVFEVRKQQGWLEVWRQHINPWTYRGLESVIRQRVRFVTDLRGLLLDLGDYFKLTWTRNHGGPYASAIFQVESLTLDCTSNSVAIEAIWRNDANTSSNAFLLDTEASLIRASGSGGRTLTVTQSSATVTFSSGSLVTDGVVAGDHLVLLDSGASEAHWWQRHRAIRIASRDSATQLTLTGDLDFGATTAGISGWQIRKSHLTAATPLYGKVADAVEPGAYSDATPAHQLREG